MTDPIRELLLYSNKTDKRATNTSLRISDSGDLLIEVLNSGIQVKIVRGHWSYKDLLTIPSQYKDTVLLYLLKEHFTSLYEIKEWIKGIGIPAKLETL